MATYGKYEVVTYPSGYAVTDMQTHEWMHDKMISDIEKARSLATRLMNETKNSDMASETDFPETDDPEVKTAAAEYSGSQWSAELDALIAYHSFIAGVNWARAQQEEGQAAHVALPPPP